MLEDNINKIDWNFLSENPEAMHILFKNKHKIKWYPFLKNSKIIYKNDYFKIEEKIKYMSKTELSILAKNSNEFTTKLYFSIVPEKEINMCSICENESEQAINYVNNIFIKDISTFVNNEGYMNPLISNSKGIFILINNHVAPSSVWYNYINSYLVNPYSKDTVEKIQTNIFNNKGKIWNVECNPSAIETLKKNKDKLVWRGIFSNSEIFELDYEGIKKEMWKKGGIKEGLEAYFSNPHRINIKHILENM